MWDKWVIARAKSTGTILPYLKDITLCKLTHWIFWKFEKDRTECPPNTLHHICCGILRYVLLIGRKNVDIFQDK